MIRLGEDSKEKFGKVRLRRKRDCLFCNARELGWGKGRGGDERCMPGPGFRREGWVKPPSIMGWSHLVVVREKDVKWIFFFKESKSKNSRRLGTVNHLKIFLLKPT